VPVPKDRHLCYVEKTQLYVMFNACVVPFVLLANVAIESAVPDPTVALWYCAIALIVTALLIAVETYWKLWESVQVAASDWIPTLTVARAPPAVEPEVDAVPCSEESNADFVEKFEDCASVIWPTAQNLANPRSLNTVAALDAVEPWDDWRPTNARITAPWP
jgi:hypothetical protein